jgi:putative oxygen-independent coproporphyrinogen III oxidase
MEVSATMPTMTEPKALPPLSAYIHIPWCVKKCPYCDFNSHGIEDAELPELDYLYALAMDLEDDLPLVQDRKLESIFFGGGTPSLFSDTAIGNLITLLDKTVGFADNCEITLEANPGTFEAAKFAGYKELGVTRLSIGVQSFETEKLEKLGRIHSADEAIRAFGIARDAGFDNINLDLMHGLPNQSSDQALADLQQAIDLGPEHISWYELTIEPNTEYFKRPPRLPSESILASINDEGHALLDASGYKRYETSAYCRDDKRARHNMNYWQYGDYLGIGAGAHGKLTDANGIHRFSKTRAPTHYLNARNGFRIGETTIEKEDQAFEFLMNALRLIDGSSFEIFESRTDLSLEEINKTIDRLCTLGYLERDTERFWPSTKGVRYLNNCLMELMV